MLECVVNVSEGRRQEVLDALVAAAGAETLDVHTDPHHNRSVLTLIGEQAPRRLTRAAVERLDITAHEGAHPRIGVVDVVPFVPLGHLGPLEALRARDDYARWVAAELEVPVFLYGPEHTLPDVRRHAFKDLAPAYGPGQPHPRAGAIAAGARPLLVAWNLYLRDPDLDEAKRIAAAVRGPHLRALGLAIGREVQVSMNLIAPDLVGPAEAWDLVAKHAARHNGIDRAELVGLVPRAVLERTPTTRWDQLDLDPQRTIEARVKMPR